ncbi:MAG: cytochrome b/b6 domain-containing protein [Terriglobales bacterium]
MAGGANKGQNDEPVKKTPPRAEEETGRAAGGEGSPVEGIVEKIEMVAEETEPGATAIPVPADQELPEESPAQAEGPDLVRAAYEHPLPIRITHWVNAISLFVMVTSGLRIFRAFPSFGPKIPEKVLLDIPKSLTLGGWLGGALQWHFTFMWLFAASGVFYLGYQVVSGHYRTMLFTPRDIPGVWPMAKHYFLFGPKPAAMGQYNPLQKLAYTSTVGFGALSLLTGIVLFKPAQFSWLAFAFGGFHLTRIWHFAAMCGFLAFIPGHLMMVLLHGWSNFYSMLSGWKREPEYQE